jgi:hypothetical protein
VEGFAMRLQNNGVRMSTRNDSVISLNSTINSHTGAGLNVHGSFSLSSKLDDASFLKLVAYESTAINANGTIAENTNTKTVDGEIAEIQTITTSVDDTIGGTFTLSYDGSVTTSLASDISAADVLSALSSLTGLSAELAVTSAATATAGCYTWAVTFTGLGNMAELVAVSSLTGTNAAVSIVTTQAGQTSGTLVDFRSNGKLWVRHGVEVIGDFEFQNEAVPGGAEITRTDATASVLTATAESRTDADVTATPFAGTIMAVEADAIHANNFTLLQMGTTESGVIDPMFTVLGDGKTTVQAGGISVGQHHGANIAEIQTITTSVDDTVGGTFTLAFGVSTTTALTNDVSANDLLTALNLLTGLSSGVAVSRSNAATAGCYTWTVTFAGLGNVAELVATSSLTGTNAGIVVLTTQIGRSLDEIQTVTTSVDDSIEGTFALSFGSHTTTFVAVDASAVDMQAALSSLTGLSSGLTVSRVSTATSGCYTWSVTFSGLGNVAQLVASTLTTASPTASPTEAPTPSPTTAPTTSPTASPTAARRLLMSKGFDEGEDWVSSGRRALGDSLTGTSAAITIETIQEGRAIATAFNVKAGGLVIESGGEIVELGGFEITAGDLQVGTNRVEIQTVTTSVDDTIGGSFTLEFDGSTTTALTSDVSAINMLAALNDLSNINSGVSVTRIDTTASGCFAWYVTFTGLGDVGELIATSSLTGTAAAVTVVTSKAYLPSVWVVNTASQQGIKHTSSSNGHGIDLQATATGHYHGALLTV